ncbi:hypothetical protein BUALT_Bualt05G0144200 [Buddleja alternifolia]|uniref:Heparanase-like protein 2 n=1 Tax=Buddleja alternifolia TaxID=168488 RepID=A0AAV6XUX3_9LAMI|nr:hypothetical protein BUALT_Bualt05G0144200 [Buddleja alternifolia]
MGSQISVKRPKFEMGSKRVLIYCMIIIVSLFYLCCAEEVKVRVKGLKSIAKTDENFICATLDWTPETKCNYNQCPQGKTGILSLDLKNKILANAIKAFSPLRIRIGGSIQDQVVYKVGKSAPKCPHFKPRKNGLFGFSEGCLQMERWDLINKFFNETGARITFGLNALRGRKKSKHDNTLMIGDWDPKNAYDFMKYTASKGYKIDSYELGNELCGSGVAARIEAEQYGKDIIVLKKLVQELYPNPAKQPKVLGPAGFYDKQWFDTFLQASGPNVVDGLTHHIYNLGAGVDPTLINKVQDPYFLDRIAQTYKDISNSIESFGPWAGAWVGEAGGAYRGGSKDVSHAFVDGFWYLDQLGMTSTFNHKVFCRQSLIGGNYGLLNTTTFVPNPDYYGLVFISSTFLQREIAVGRDWSEVTLAGDGMWPRGGGADGKVIEEDEGEPEMGLGEEDREGKAMWATATAAVAPDREGRRMAEVSVLLPPALHPSRGLDPSQPPSLLHSKGVNHYGRGALLWHRLMGTNVLAASHTGSPYLRVYSHCSKKTAGISILLINMSNSTTFEVSVVDEMNLYPEQYKSIKDTEQREEYHLTPKDGNIQSDVLLLNGTLLKLTETFDIPSMNPRLVDSVLPVKVVPDSIVFATLKGFKAPACA